jgi:adenylyl-sulfate kinase
MTSMLRSQRGAVVWLTGLPGSGKTTIAHGFADVLAREDHAAYVLDGDALRKGLNSDLGFSPLDRSENVRRVGHVAALFGHAGIVAIVALISPYGRDRALARVAAERLRVPFFEVYVAADAQTCAARDPKGLYRRALGGQLSEFTGVDAPYEVPTAPSLVIDSAHLSVAASIAMLHQHVHAHTQRLG